MVVRLTRFLGKTLHRVLVAAGALALGGAMLAVANYSATQGSGTTFGSIVIGGVHFISALFCDATTANQCAAVSAGGAVKVDNSAVTQPVSGTITANAGTNLNTSTLATSANQTNASAKTQVVDGSGNVMTAQNANSHIAPDVVINDASGNRLSGLVTGTFGTPSTQVLSVQNNDPCSYAAKSSASISVTSATTTQLVAISGSTVIYTCGFAITIAPSATTADTAQFEYGTSTNCTGTNALTGTLGNGDLTTAAPPLPVTYGSGNSTIFKTAAANGLCIVTAGNTVNVQGVLTYVQQ